MTETRGKKHKPKSATRKLKWYLFGGVGIVLAIVGLLFLGKLPEKTNDPNLLNLPEIKVTVVEGTVQIQRPDNSDFEEVKAEQIISEGLTVRTEEEGRGTVIVGGEVHIRLDQNSRLLVKSVESQTVYLELIGGQVWLYQPVDAVKVVISSTQARISSAESAKKHVLNISQDNNKTTVMGITGETGITALAVNAETQGLIEKGEVVLKSKKQTTLRASSIPESGDDFRITDLSEEFKEGEWYRFNRDRDRDL